MDMQRDPIEGPRGAFYERYHLMGKIVNVRLPNMEGSLKLCVGTGIRILS